jgi:hypothetical protein
VVRSASLTVAAVALAAAALSGCSVPASPHPAASASASRLPSPTLSPPATSPLPALSLQPGVQPPPVTDLAWSPGTHAGQVRLEWHLPAGSTSVDSFRIRYLINGRQQIVETEYFFDVRSGLASGDELRAFVLARGEAGNSREVESPPWTQP